MMPGRIIHLKPQKLRFIGKRKRKKRFHRKNGEKSYENISVGDLSDDG
jgi:hypothetical protein